MRTSALGLVVVAVVTAACASPATAQPTVSASPATATAAAYQAERVTLFVHCGITGADVDGRHWAAEPPRPAPQYAPGPDGVVHVSGYVSGVWTRTGPDRASFVIDDPNVAPGQTPVLFRSAPAPTSGRCV